MKTICSKNEKCLQKHGKSEEEAYKIVSEEMWKFLNPSGMQKFSKTRFFMGLMKKIVPLGFSKKSGIGWRYVWHKDTDSKDESQPVILPNIDNILI
ncbi:MAG: hypothetical protein K5873_06400 [Treponema sp.]|nr:hypothetical protein [Treponema sp.]